MTTLIRLHAKYRLELREKDHLPPHVHLTGAGVDVMIGLCPVAVLAGKAPRLVLKEALQWVSDHQQHLLNEWQKWHPL